MEDNNNLKQDDRVSFDIQVLKGTGKVVGVASSEQAIIGKSYIIEPDEPIFSDVYPYSHIVVFAIHLKLIS